MRIQTIWFVSLLILTTLFMQYAFFWFNINASPDYPLGRVPDNHFHYTQVILHDMATGMKYIGTHVIFWVLAMFFPAMITFNIVLPIMFSLLLPLGVFAMTKEYTDDTNIAILASLMFAYGTDVIATIYQIAVWPQGWNMVLTCFAIACGIRYIKTKSKRWIIPTLILLVWSALAHMQFAMASCAIGLIFLVAHRRYLETFVLALTVTLLMFKFRHLYTLQIVSNEFYVNPLMLLFSIFPLNAIMALYGLWLARKYTNHWKNLLLFAPAMASGFFIFVDPNYRLYMNMYMFLSPFMAIGLMKAVTQIASIISQPFDHPIRHLWLKRGLFASYLSVMIIFFLMFNVYVSYSAVMNQEHGTETMKDNMDKYYPPPTLNKFLQAKRIENAKLGVNDFCIKCMETCENNTSI